MRDLSTRNLPVLSSMMARGEDRVFAQSGLARITFRILWPGYSVDWARTIELSADGPITRARLAQVIAQNFSRFMEVHRNDKTSVPEFTISPTSLRFEHLVLVSLNNLFEDSWQAEVVIDFR
ncbi:hypothetical protein NLJ89_g12319 [Agrocybe chaxingu]|uniref:Uncharacterized protein n=1 Tax=Agrocybe chaxingu TaxID=84603 RepID=A0A9W8JM34_9AGAR|nr:hypothetical protein NLJ89_g12319 [Agrocybe chaxingu]